MTYKMKKVEIWENGGLAQNPTLISVPTTMISKQWKILYKDVFH